MTRPSSGRYSYLRSRRYRRCGKSLRRDRPRDLQLSKTPKAANLVKLSGNFLIASVIESVGEALALVSKGGVDRRQYINILTPTLFNAPVYKTYGGLLAERNFEPAGFAAPFGHKDIRLALAAAEEMRVAMPLASLLNDQGS